MNAFWDRFRLTVQPLLVAAGSMAKTHRLEGYRWDEGLNMEDGIEMEQAVHDAYSQLNNERRMRDQGILLGVTGGDGLCSSVGTAAADTRKCSFAWVNRNDYSLQVYRSVPVWGNHPLSRLPCL